MANPQGTKPRELTGRTVLFSLIGFFGVIIAVNAVMVKAATSTFGGVQTSSSYKAGLQFSKEIAAAERQAALNWRVEGKLIHDKAGEAILDIAVRDAKGQPVTGLAAAAHLEHPADSRRDHEVPLKLSGTGQFHGVTGAPAGQWELIVDLERDGERVFRSRSRITLK